MNSHPSTSFTLNGHSNFTNGVSHSDAGQSDSYDTVSTSGSSSMYPTNGLSHTVYQNHHNEEIVHHLYHSGFQTGNYFDTILHVQQNMYRLHAIILSRSPYLAHLMSTTPQAGAQRVIHVRLDEEPEVTQESFAIALGYLYSAISLDLIRPDNARAVLAAGCLLGGMDDFCQYAYETCRRSITVNSIGDWLAFVDAIPLPDGSSDLAPLSSFVRYALRLRNDVFHFLVAVLPDVLEINKPSQEQQEAKGRDVLLQVYARAPFEIFKAAVESLTFHIGSDQARFKFAKDAIELRKKGIARDTGAEETVVLAFGSSNYGGSAVHITRKVRKHPLWKVNS